jgi:hypothetical protein
MVSESRVSPPTSTPALDTTVAKELHKHTDGLRMCTELVNAANKQNGKVQDMRAARVQLVDTKLLDKDQNFGRAELFTTLMKILLLLQAAIGKMSNMLCTLAYMSEYMHSEATQEVADCMAEAVSEALSPAFKGVTKGTDMVIGLAGEATQVCAKVTAVADSVRTEMLELKEQSQC